MFPQQEHLPSPGAPAFSFPAIHAQQIGGSGFSVDGQVLVVPVPDGSGVVKVTVDGVDGQSCVVKFTIAES
ncbi:MAG TPA: hypothetical protein VN748_17045 [Pseudonocardiaceae bacterium]|nr:hypothetical protein [Pseudonocardiaceae bacterium]